MSVSTKNEKNESAAFLQATKQKKPETFQSSTPVRLIVVLVAGDPPKGVRMKLRNAVGVAAWAVCLARTRAEEGEMLSDSKFFCVAYPGGICETTTPKGSMVQALQNMNDQLIGPDAINEVVQALSDSMAQYVSPACKEAMLRLSCSSFLGSCQTIGGISVKQLPCQDMCIRVHKECAAFYSTMRSLGNFAAIQNCGLKEYSADLNTDRPNIFGERVGAAFAYYPEAYHGQPTYPVESSYVSLPDGTTSKLQCLTESEIYAAEYDPTPIVCNPPLQVEEATNTCRMPCPHPLYTHSEYTELFSVVSNMGIFSFAVSFFYLVFVMHSYNKQRKRMKAKDVLIKFELTGGVLSILYAITGPLTAGLFNNSNNFGMVCTSSKEAKIFESTDEISSQSFPCHVNKASSFFLQMIFCVLTIHLRLVYQKLGMAIIELGRKQGASSQSLGTAAAGPTATQGLVIGPGVSLILMVIMYVIEGLPLESPAHAGNIARWTAMCGPRLEMLPEVSFLSILK